MFSTKNSILGTFAVVGIFIIGSATQTVIAAGLAATSAPQTSNSTAPTVKPSSPKVAAGEVEAKADWQCGIHRLAANHFHLSGCGAFLDKRPVNGVGVVILKRAVLNEFGIESAIVGMIDFLGHQAAEVGRDGDAGFADVDIERRGGGLCAGGRDAEMESP